MVDRLVYIGCVMDMSLFRSGLISGAGAAFAVFFLSLFQLFDSQLVLLMAPFGATTVLLFVLPASPLAQPRNVVLGHFLTALVGLIFLHAFGNDWLWWAVATGVGIFIMVITKSTHPPAGANPMLIMMTGQSWWFLIEPVLSGAILLVLLAKLYHWAIKFINLPEMRNSSQNVTKKHTGYGR